MSSVEARQLAAILRAMPRKDNPSIGGSRRAFEGMARMYPAPADTRVDTISLGGVRAERLIAPEVDPTRAVFYVHGGGFAMGSPATHRELGVRLARAAGCPVWLPDYRLAPEHPFPAGLDDVVAAYRGLVAEGIDPARIVIAGDSAGGGLVVSSLIALRDAGAPLPAAGVCLSPWADLTLTSASIEGRTELDPWIGRPGLALMVKAYVGDGDPARPLVSPALADLRGLPPLLVLVGTAEVLHDDAATLASRAREAGVAVTFEAWEDMVHVWPMFPHLPEARAAVSKIGRFVRERTA